MFSFFQRWDRILFAEGIIFSLKYFGLIENVAQFSDMPPCHGETTTFDMI